MKIVLPVAQQQSLTFTSLNDLAEHYSALSAGYMNEAARAKTQKEARFSEGKGHAYAIVAWQISRMTLE